MKSTADIRTLIREIPDFPKPGILFRDITTLLQNADGLRATIDLMAEQVSSYQPDCIVGIESRGFIFGMPLAYQLGLSFIPVRKPGKLPAAVHQISYDLEYGQDSLEVHQDALHKSHRPLIVDDLLATGGTAAATAQLIQQTGATIAGFSFVIELKELNGRQKLPDGIPVNTLLSY
ncbi:adenine phosphoribosyltransferase [Leptolyngbya sp. Heron Island J]|uniref:adenine phosphoribosyltransferase n=1 Tax=Leptolyngbya sp. Heron Island J TaxID=1385935 RepID=UPI0003B9B688|nr:adenine phosphoribosyltransferase [Leptolyngbya sp. Heron Island J]ESA32269.1 adenine phosphoribosyltransferase [Leptolyngbya sp. Heron Island J]